MSNKDLFAPPTEEEKNLFAPPSSTELDSLSKDTPKISQGESFLKGAQQGATLGFGDEIQGGIEGGLDKTQQLLNQLGLASPSPTQVNVDLAAHGTKGDIGPQSTLDMYRQARDASRADFDAAEKAHPLTSAAGNVVGGALLALAAPQALMNPLGSAEATAPLLQKMATGAANAVPAGLTMGLGNSNADLTQGQIAPAAIDTAIGGATAGVIGGALPAVTSTLGGIKNSVSQSKIMQDLLDSYKAGMKKVDLSNPEFLTQSRDQLKKLTGQADDAIRASTQKLFGDKKQLLTDLETAGVKADTKNALQGLMDTQGAKQSVLKSDENRAITGTIKNILQKGYLQGPQEIENTLSQLKDLRGSTETSAGKEMVDTAVNQLKAIQNSMDPRIQEINGQLNHVIDASDALMKRGALEYGNAGQDLANKEAMASLLESTGKYKTDSFLNDILDKGLETSKNTKINPLSQTVPEAAKFLRDAAPLVRNMNLAKGMQGSTIRGSNAVDATANFLKGNATKLANKAGNGVSENQEFLQKGVKYLADSTPEGLKRLSDKLVNTAGVGGKEYARVLQTAIDKNNVSKNAIMFGLMQQPEFRALLHKTMNEDTSENGQ